MSQQPVTIEDIYDLFRTSREEMRISREEYDRRSAEADHRFTESKAQSDRRIAEQESLAAAAKIESDRCIKAIKERISKLEEYIVDKYNPSSYIEKTNIWEDFVNKLATHDTADKLFLSRDIEINYISRGATSYRLESEIKVDILFVSDREILTVMCLPEIHHNDIDEFIEKLKKFKLAFPAYKDYQAYGAVAGIEINQGIDRYAYQQGLFVIRPSGETVEIVNDQKFQAKIW
jgi:hypothetical protein